METMCQEMGVPIANMSLDMCATAQEKTVAPLIAEMASWLDLNSVTTGTREHASITAWDLQKGTPTTDLQR